jgi:hypothetical protein
MISRARSGVIVPGDPYQPEPATSLKSFIKGNTSRRQNNHGLGTRLDHVSRSEIVQPDEGLVVRSAAISAEPAW